MAGEGNNGVPEENSQAVRRIARQTIFPIVDSTAWRREYDAEVVHKNRRQVALQRWCSQQHEVFSTPSGDRLDGTDRISPYRLQEELPARRPSQHIIQQNE